MAFLGSWTSLAALRHSVGDWGYTAMVGLVSSKSEMSAGAIPHTCWRICRSYLPSLWNHAEDYNKLVTEYLKLWFKLLWISLLMKRRSSKTLDLGLWELSAEFWEPACLLCNTVPTLDFMHRKASWRLSNYLLSQLPSRALKKWSISMVCAQSFLLPITALCYSRASVSFRRCTLWSLPSTRQ